MWEWFVRPTLFLQFHQPRDQLIADRGFTMVEEFVKQLSPKEIEVYRKIGHWVVKKNIYYSSGPIGN
ncbi:hypothetical protein LSH36_50g00027 [Paralvinella palmiformis]|uniref:Uncharacterized protein n=1 Tax=Paralvinella palmiformis TaxID=53620 RepID=A0AAD9NCN3_9ANNE|nr:hypothetical protein LSH36_50g00027 [Paralvinella palmiformis]